MGLGHDPGMIDIDIDVFGGREDMHVVVQRSPTEVGHMVDSDDAQDWCSVLFSKHVLFSYGLILPLEFSGQAPVEQFKRKCGEFTEFADS